MSPEQLDLFAPTPTRPTPVQSPRLAVVIPCYNHAIYIDKALRSVLDQTRPVDRIIVIDDGSKDDSVAVIKAMKEPRIELFTQENQNAFNAINRGVAMAAKDCDFVAILNSDDHYHPERFEKLLPLLENDPNAQVVCSGLHIIDENDAPLPEEHPRRKWFNAIWSLEPRDDLEIAEWLGLGNFPATTSNILARAAYMVANPMRPYHFNHDYYFLTGAAIRGALRIDSCPLVNYRVHSSNTMNTEPARLMKELLRQQTDFLRNFHTELSANPDARRRYKLYMQAAFENISAFDTGLFFHVLGIALQSADAKTLDTAITELTTDDLPELMRFPNRHHVTTWPGGGPLGEASSMPEKLDALRAARDSAKNEAADLKSLSNALATIASDKRFAFGRLLGLAPNIHSLPGKSASEKLSALRNLAQSSPWMNHLPLLP